jgi:hypothetical protein
MNQWKSERVSYQNGIRDFRSFDQSETQKLRSVQPLFCLKTELSSDVDRHNSVTSRTLSGQSHMSNE